MNLKVKELSEKEKLKFGILYENQIMGVPQLRQLRVREGSCPVARRYQHLDRVCYPEYDKQEEDRGDPSNGNYWNDVYLVNPNNPVNEA